MSAVSLVPYFGGHGRAAPSPAEKRPAYLRRTVASLGSVAGPVFIGVCRPEDFTSATDGLSARAVMLDCEPHLLPLELVRLAQREGLASFHDHVYVTEADQVLHLDREFLKTVKGRDYLVPHRLEQLGPDGQGRDRGPVVVHDWALEEYTMGERPEPPLIPAPLYEPDGLVDGYGGAFLCSAEFFSGMQFTLSEDQPVEDVTGFAAYRQGHALKTTEWNRFYVEHLSGYDYHCKLPSRNG